LASRLEGQSKPYGVKIVLGEKTAELVKDNYNVIELDNRAVKGKTIGVKIYTIGKTRIIGHKEFLNLYYNGDWKKAIFVAQTLLNDPEVTIHEYYEKMIERLEEGKPDNWDGTYRATSK
jgi:adenylate cyclase